MGLAAGRIDVMMPLLRDWDFDVLITHNRWTLVNRNAEPMLELAAERGIAVMNAAPYAGGALAKGAGYGRYVYQEATEAMLAPVRRVEAVCARHGVPPGAAALQFSMRDPRIVATICGVTRPERVRGDAGLGGVADRRRRSGPSSPTCRSPPTTPRRRATTSPAERMPTRGVGALSAVRPHSRARSRKPTACALAPRCRSGARVARGGPSPAPLDPPGTAR